MIKTQTSDHRNTVSTTTTRAARGLATLKPKPAAPASNPPSPALAAAPASAKTESQSDSEKPNTQSDAKAKAKAQPKAKAIAQLNERNEHHSTVPPPTHDSATALTAGSGAKPTSKPVSAAALAPAAAVKPQRIAVQSLKSAVPAPKWSDADADANPQQPLKPQKSVGGGSGGDAKNGKSKLQVEGSAVAGGAAKPKPSAAAATDAKTKDVKASVDSSPGSADDDDGSGGADGRLSCVKSFDDLKLHDSILRGIYAYGYEQPSVIQQRAIAPVIAGQDTIAQAQSGTGKTATFVIAALQRLDVKQKNAQILILSPTRELAGQTARVAKAIGDYYGANIMLCTGGTQTAVDRQALAAGAQVIVGTPGRVLALLSNGSMKAKHLQLLVLDEADEILSQGFQEQMYSVFELLPPTIQIAMFSATLPTEALELAKRFMRSPVRITIKKEEVTLDGIKQFFVDISGDSTQRSAAHPRARDKYAVAASDDAAKLETLVDLYSTISVSQCIIYANTRRRVEWLAEELNARDFTVSAIHSDMEFDDRKRVMNEFRLGASRVLIATDLLARGIDVQGVSLVINFDLPKVRESYIHRIGRSGRFGRKGVAINFICNRNDVACIAELQEFYATAINELPGNIKDLI